MTPPFCLGLTGSIGMGKSTTAAMFAEAGIPVWNADTAVHGLYAKGGAAVPGIAALSPDAIVGGTVDRSRLAEWIGQDSARLALVEAAVHPLVQEDRARFLRDADSDILVLDIPLLYETGSDAACDAVAVVSVDSAEQRRRVLARPGMTEARFDAIMSRQLPDAEKRARADYIIPTDSIESARTAVHSVLADIREKRHA